MHSNRGGKPRTSRSCFVFNFRSQIDRLSLQLAYEKQESRPSDAMLRNMLDGDGQDQFDAGGWCFPKPIPPVQRNGEWIVSAVGPRSCFFRSQTHEWKVPAHAVLRAAQRASLVLAGA